MKSNPIILIDHDEEDCQLFKDACDELNIKNEVTIFNTSKEAFDHLSSMAIQPFFIICDVNMPHTNGLELRQKINENEQLRLRAMPYLLWSTMGSESLVNEAYSLNIQGFFKKPNSIKELKKMILSIIDYWNCSHHPLSNYA
jgi:CheY-like chemotaxis protein